ncbi:hypothetical protein ACM614_13230, partial [Streptomyces sp. 12297]
MTAPFGVAALARPDRPHTLDTGQGEGDKEQTLIRWTTALGVGALAAAAVLAPVPAAYAAPGG